MSYELLSKTEPLARKQYRCIWCPEMILKGEKHVHEASKFDGDFQDHRWHLECSKASREVFASGDEEFEAGSHKRGTIEEA